MKIWANRPKEVGNLMNPAFCSLILRSFVIGYMKEKKESVEIPLLFIALPLILHSDTRHALPITIATKHHSWLEANQQLRIGFAKRCRDLVPYIKETLNFACQHSLLSISQNACVEAPAIKLKKPLWDASDEAAQCLKAALFVGRWIANAGSTGTIYSLWGLKP